MRDADGAGWARMVAANWRASARTVGTHATAARGMSTWRAGVAWGGWGEGAGLPEQDQLLQSAEQANEAGDDQGVQRIRQPAGRVVRLGGDAQAGELGGQEGWMN